MEFTKILMTPRGTYFYRGASSTEMSILGCFFSSDVRCDESDAFKQWALISENGDNCGGNAISLAKEKNTEHDCVLLTDDYSGEDVPTVMRIPTHQFVQLLDEWHEKVIQLRPKEVTVKHDYGQFFIETAD